MLEGDFSSSRRAFLSGSVISRTSSPLLKKYKIIKTRPFRDRPAKIESQPSPSHTSVKSLGVSARWELESAVGGHAFLVPDVSFFLPLLSLSISLLELYFEEWTSGARVLGGLLGCIRFLRCSENRCTTRMLT